MSPSTVPAKKKFEILDYDGLMALPDPEWLIPELIPKRGLVMLYGPSNTGKSFIALSMLCSVTTGKSFLPGTSTKHGTALYCFGEGGAGIKPRVEGWYRANRKRGRSASVKFHSGSVNLFDDGEVEAFIDCIKQKQKRWRRHLEMTVFDTLATCTAGADENSNTDMGIVMRNCERVRQELNTTVVLVHHSGKGGSVYRGASVTMCNVDTTLKLVPKRKDCVELEVEKQKDAERLPNLEVTLNKIELPRKLTTLVAECIGYAQGKGSAANDNFEESSVQKAKRCLYTIIESYGISGISWTDARAEAKEQGHGTERSSDLNDAKRKLLKEGSIREAKGKLVAIDAIEESGQIGS